MEALGASSLCCEIKLNMLDLHTRNVRVPFSWPPPPYQENPFGAYRGSFAEFHSSCAIHNSLFNLRGWLEVWF